MTVADDQAGAAYASHRIKWGARYVAMIMPFLDEPNSTRPERRRGPQEVVTQSLYKVRGQAGKHIFWLRSIQRL